VIRVILLDAVLLIAVVIGANLEIERVTALAGEITGLSPSQVKVLLALAGGVIIVPLMYGVITSARALGRILATRAFPEARPGKIDPADAPRRALVIVVQIAVVIAVGVPVVAITQPFLPRNQGAAVFAVLTLGLFLMLWRNASDLEGHARAGAQIIASALAHQMASTESAEPDTKWLKLANTIVPGLGEPVAIRVTPQSLAAGRSLASLNLRGATGATVLAIRRGEEQIPNPLGREIIYSGDLLAVAGEHDALAVARGVLAPDHPRHGDEPVSPEIEADIEAVNQVLRMRRV